MPLTPTPVELPLAGGIDLKTDPRLVQVPNNLQAVNVRWPSAGAVDQRFGQTKLPVATSLSKTVTVPPTNLAPAIPAWLGANFATAVYPPSGAAGVTATVVSTIPYPSPGSPVAPSPSAIEVQTGTVTTGGHFLGAYTLIPVQPNTTYTASIYVASASQLTLRAISNSATPTNNEVVVGVTSAGWQRVTISFTTETDATSVAIGTYVHFFVFGSGVGPIVYTNGVQLELGDVASPWGVGGPSSVVLEPVTITQGSAVGATNAGELLLHGNDELYAYSQSSQVWLPRGQAQSFDIATTGLGPSTGSPRGVASAVSGTIQVTAYEDSATNACYYSVFDLANNSVVIAPTVLAMSSFNPTAVAVGNSVFVFYIATDGIRGARIDTSTPWQVPVPYLACPGSFSAMRCATDGSAHVFFATTQPVGNRLYAVRVNPWEIAITISFSGTTAFDVRWDADLSVLLLASYASTNLTFTVLDAALSTLAAATNVHVPSAPSAQVIQLAGAGTAAVFFDFGGVEIEYVYPVTYSTATVTTAASTVVANNLHPASHAQAGLAVFSSRQTVPPNLTPTNQQTYFLCQIASTGQPRPVFMFFSQVAASASREAVIPELYTLDDGTLVTGLLQQTALRVSASGSIYTAASVSSVRLTPSGANDVISEATSETLVSAGNLYAYDGANLTESGFWQYPEGIVATVIPGAGSVPVVPPAGVQNSHTVFYQVTYEEVDAAGNIHYSAPSFEVGGATGLTIFPGSAVELVIPTLQLTLRKHVTIGVYRAAADTVSPLYKVASIANDPTVQTVTVFDTQADSAILGQPFLYAPADGSGEVENSTPPSMSSIVVTKNRAFGISAENPYQVWYSKPLVPGREVQWSNVFTLQVEWAGGPCVGLGYVDQYALVFKHDRIYFLPGDGPDATGKNGSFGALQTISVSGGCSNPQSIVCTADGCWFLSPVGLANIQKGGITPDYEIGLPVQPLARSLTLTGGELVPDLNCVRWTSTQGVAIVYDYILKQWHTDTNYAAVSATVWQNKFVRLAANGSVFYEDSSRYDDDGQPVQALIETCYIKPGQLTQGYGAVWYGSLLGTYYSSHSLLVQVEYDYLGVPSHTHVFNATVNGNLGTYGDTGPYGFGAAYGTSVPNTYTAPYQPRIAFQRQTCQSVKLTISIQGGATQRALTLTTLALLIGSYGGINRVPMRQDI